MHAGMRLVCMQGCDYLYAILEKETECTLRRIHIIMIKVCLMLGMAAVLDQREYSTTHGWSLYGSQMEHRLQVNRIHIIDLLSRF